MSQDDTATQQDADFQDDVGLTIGNRMNWQYLLSKAVSTYLNALVKQEGDQSPQEIMSAAKAIHLMIPDAWKLVDDQFNKDIDAATQVTRRDTRKTWCGVRVGAANYTITKTYNAERLFHACVNLFERRGLLSRTMYEEIATGRRFQKLEATMTNEEE